MYFDQQWRFVLVAMRHLANASGNIHKSNE
jgi:hypothetical protein